MKKLFAVFVLSLFFSSFVFGAFAIASLDERVKNSDLIVIGTLQTVSEYETETFEISKGTLVIEKSVWGNVKTELDNPLKSGDLLDVQWQNSKMFACRFGFPENAQGIWLLQIEENGTIAPLYVGALASMDELTKIKQLLKKKEKSSEKINKTVKLQIIADQTLQVVNSETAGQLLYSEKTKTTKYYPFEASLTILISFLLYYLLYRSRFKIR